MENEENRTELDMPMESNNDQETLFTTAEIILATGLPRGTITNRAKYLGFDRTGHGYTAAQVLAMVIMPMELHRRDERRATELRAMVNKMLKRLDLPMEIVQQEDGKVDIEYYRCGRKMRAGSDKKGGAGK